MFQITKVSRVNCCLSRLMFWINRGLIWTIISRATNNDEAERTELPFSQK